MSCGCGLVTVNLLPPPEPVGRADMELLEVVGACFVEPNSSTKPLAPKRVAAGVVASSEGRIMLDDIGRVL